MEGYVFDNPKQILTERVKQNIAKSDYEALIIALPIAEEEKVSQRLLYKGWKIAADFQESKNDIIQAIVSYNKARQIKPSVIFVFDKVVSLIERFLEKNKEGFSKTDLKLLKTTLETILNYHSVKFANHKKIVEHGRSLLDLINYREEYIAKDALETPLTFPVEKIYNAITENMTMQEVKQEAAHTFAEIIRRGKSKEKQKKKSKK